MSEREGQCEHVWWNSKEWPEKHRIRCDRIIPPGWKGHSGKHRKGKLLEWWGGYDEGGSNE